MKKYSILTAVLLLSFALTSFTDKRGGDMFEVYLNGKQVHQQFVHADKSAKTIQLSSLTAKDNLAVFYSHCGYAGKSRFLTLRDEQDAIISVFKFPDVSDNKSRMGFSVKDVAKLKKNKVRLYYASKELPEGKLLATLSWGADQHLAKN